MNNNNNQYFFNNYLLYKIKRAEGEYIDIQQFKLIDF